MACPFGKTEEHEEVQELDNVEDPVKDQLFNEAITEQVAKLPEKAPILNRSEAAGATQGAVAESTQAVSAGTAAARVDVFNENLVNAVSETGGAMVEQKVTPKELVRLEELVEPATVGEPSGEELFNFGLPGPKIVKPGPASRGSTSGAAGEPQGVRSSRTASRGSAAGAQGEPASASAKSVRAVASRGAASGTDIADMLAVSENFTAARASNLLPQAAALEAARRIAGKGIQAAKEFKAPQAAKPGVQPKGPPSILDRPRFGGKTTGGTPAGGGFHINFTDRMQRALDVVRKKQNTVNTNFNIIPDG